jgi:hypothetical protein
MVGRNNPGAADGLGLRLAPRLPESGIPTRGRPHSTLARRQEKANRKVLARFTDVCEKQFSSLAANRDRIERFLKEALSA